MWQLPALAIATAGPGSPAGRQLIVYFDFSGDLATADLVGAIVALPRNRGNQKENLMTEEKKETRTRYSFDFSGDLTTAALVARVLEESAGENLHSQLAEAARELDDNRHPKPEPISGKPEIVIVIEYRMSSDWEKAEILAGRMPMPEKELRLPGVLCPEWLLDTDFVEFGKRGEIGVATRRLGKKEKSEYRYPEYGSPKTDSWAWRNGHCLTFDQVPTCLEDITDALQGYWLTPKMVAEAKAERVAADARIAETKAKAKAEAEAKAKAEAKAEAEAKAKAKAKAEAVTAALAAWLDAGNSIDHPRNLRSEGFPWESATKAEFLTNLLSESPFPVIDLKSDLKSGMDRDHVQGVNTPKPGLLKRYSSEKIWLLEQAKAYEGLEIGGFKIELFKYSSSEDDPDTFLRYELCVSISWPEYGISETVYLDLTKKTD